MKRRTFTLVLATDEDEIVAESTKHAFNSAIRESERMVQEYARARGVVLHGDKPWVDPTEDKHNRTRYSRIWRCGSTAGAVTVKIAEVE